MIKLQNVIYCRDPRAGRPGTQKAFVKYHPSVVPEVLTNNLCMGYSSEGEVSAGRDDVDAHGLVMKLKSGGILPTLIFLTPTDNLRYSG